MAREGDGMIKLGTQYSDSMPKNIEITNDSVFLAINIRPYEKEVEGRTISGYAYECLKYTKDEYIIKLHDDIMDTQMALIELFEGGDEV